jgi:hypothetical protein
LYFWLSEERGPYVLSWSSFIDVITIVPGYILAFSPEARASNAAGLYFLRAFR